jgi:hypothetical protein
MLEVDVRSVLLFRITLGALLLAFDLRWGCDYSQLLGPEGLGGCNGNLTWFLVFWALPFLAGCLIVGFVARLASALSLVAVCLVQHAVPEVLQGGDQLLRVLLCWGILLPIDGCWAVDRRLGLAATHGGTLRSLIVACYTVQIVCIYWFAALLKSDPVWRQSGDALAFALHIEHFTTPFGNFLAQHPAILRPLTFAAVLLEFAGPFLLLIPSKGNWLRGVAVVLFVGFHLVGMQSLFRIGLFPWACAVAWLPFIPSGVWDRLAARLRNPGWMVADVAPVARKPRGKPEIGRRQQWVGYGAGAVAVLAALDVVAWNVSSLPGAPQIPFHPFGPALDQRWDMYAPFPRREHGWLVVPADLADGSQVDLFTGKAVSWDRPKDIGAYFGDDLWRRYLSNLFDGQNPDDLKRYADYLVREWNRDHPTDQQVQDVSIVYMRQVTQPDLSDSAPERVAIYFETL